MVVVKVVLSIKLYRKRGKNLLFLTKIGSFHLHNVLIYLINVFVDRNKVFIKCDVILNSRDENELVSKLARQVGYFPVFTLMVSLSNLVDGLASATIGQKTGIH